MKLAFIIKGTIFVMSLATFTQAESRHDRRTPAAHPSDRQPSERLEARGKDLDQVTELLRDVGKAAQIDELGRFSTSERIGPSSLSVKIKASQHSAFTPYVRPSSPAVASSSHSPLAFDLNLPPPLTDEVHTVAAGGVPFARQVYSRGKFQGKWAAGKLPETFKERVMQQIAYDEAWRKAKRMSKPGEPPVLVNWSIDNDPRWSDSEVKKGVRAYKNAANRKYRAARRFAKKPQDGDAPFDQK